MAGPAILLSDLDCLEICKVCHSYLQYLREAEDKTELLWKDLDQGVNTVKSWKEQSVYSGD